MFCFQYFFHASFFSASPDIGEDVIQVKDKVKKKYKLPGQSVVFGDLFEVKKASKNTHTTTLLSHSVRGPSQCLIYIRKFRDRTLDEGSPD